MQRCGKHVNARYSFLMKHGFAQLRFVDSCVCSKLEEGISQLTARPSERSTTLSARIPRASCMLILDKDQARNVSTPWSVQSILLIRHCPYNCPFQDHFYCIISFLEICGSLPLFRRESQRLRGWQCSPVGTNIYFLFHPKNHYKLSLRVTFSNTFDNL